MIQIIYKWEVPVDKQMDFLAAWEKATVTIRNTIAGARGSFCVIGVDDPTEILTVAKWDNLDQWKEFMKGAKLKTMKEMHNLGTQISSKAYVQKGDFTVQLAADREKGCISDEHSVSPHSRLQRSLFGQNRK